MGVQATEPTTLLLSLSNGSGDTVFTSRRIALLHFGPRLMTEPIQLATGEYTIVDFLLIDDNDSVLYATPKAESPLAPAVSHPLPYVASGVGQRCCDGRDGGSGCFGRSSPEDFGYAAFYINAPNVLRKLPCL